MNKQVVLIIDDEPQIRKLLKINLEGNGFSCSEAESAEEGLVIAANHPPDLILLDVQLPNKSGVELLQELRTWYDRPIIMLSVVNDESTIVQALDVGATDYLTKPFRSAELIARIRGSLRRMQPSTIQSSLLFNDIEIDLIARSVKKDGDSIKLTATEFNLLALFAKNEGRVLTHQFILKEIWGMGFQTETQYLRVFVGTLRKKIETNPNSPVHIITESGIGYRFS